MSSAVIVLVLILFACFLSVSENAENKNFLGEPGDDLILLFEEGFSVFEFCRSSNVVLISPFCFLVWAVSYWSPSLMFLKLSDIADWEC